VEEQLAITPLQLCLLNAHTLHTLLGHAASIVDFSEGARGQELALGALDFLALLFFFNGAVDARQVEHIEIHAVLDDEFALTGTPSQLCDAKQHTIVVDVVILEEFSVSFDLLIEEVALFLADVNYSAVFKPVAIFQRSG